jgi:Fur family transcriptional regulator, ferric uptake regulator
MGTITIINLRKSFMNGKQWPQWLQEILKVKCYRITAGREAILNALVHADEHLSAEDIYLKVHSTHPAIGLTSVYRTLETLLNMGLVYKFDFQEGRARYEISEGQRGKHHHHHLVCTGCGRIIDHTDFFDEELILLKRTEESLSDKYNFKITNHLVQFYGLCSSCHDKEKV